VALQYALQPLNVVDLLAIAPFYIEKAMGGGGGSELAVVRVLRLARVLRIFKMGKHSKGMTMMGRVLVMSVPAMNILLFYSVLVVVLFGSLFYFTEGTRYEAGPGSAFAPGGPLSRGGQQGAAGAEGAGAVTTTGGMFPTGVYVRPTVDARGLEISPVRSIPGAFWWVTATMTTVGYGDFKPTTAFGKLANIGLFYIGIILVALPITILGRNFEIVYNESYDVGERMRKIAARDRKKAAKLVEIEERVRRRESDASVAQTAEMMAMLQARQASRGEFLSAASASPGVTPRRLPGSKFLAPSRSLAPSPQTTPRGRARRISEKLNNPLSSRPRHNPPWLPKGLGVRESIFLVLEGGDATRLGKWIGSAVLLVIVASTCCFCMETMPAFRETPDPVHKGCAAYVYNATLAAPPGGELAGERPAGQPQVRGADGVARSWEQACEPQPLAIFARLEAVFIAIFTAEYLARLLCVHAAGISAAGLERDRGGFRNSLAYALQPLNLIDLAAIAPWYVSAVGGGTGGGFAVLRVLRLVRIFRLFSGSKYASGAYMVVQVVIASIPALSILVFMSMLACVLFASCIFYAEGVHFSVDDHWTGGAAAGFDGAYPHGVYVRPTLDGYGMEVSPFRSIPFSFWWFFVTTTTVGYGDFYPTTVSPRCCCRCCCCCCCCCFSLPTLALLLTALSPLPPMLMVCALSWRASSYASSPFSQA
jgi:hypothetical protein